MATSSLVFPRRILLIGLVGFLSLLSIFVTWKQLDLQTFQITSAKVPLQITCTNYNSRNATNATKIPNNDEVQAINIDWVRLSPLEIQQIQASNQKSCKNPFQHCCLGQCRQERLKMDPNESLWKPVFRSSSSSTTRQLKTFLDVMDYYGATVNNQSKTTPCTIVFGGDSLSADHTMDAVCRLIEDGYELKSCNPAIGSELYGADINVACPENKYPDRAHFLLEHENHHPTTTTATASATCPEVLILSTFEIPPSGIRPWFQQPPDKVMTENDDWGGLVIFNWGARCKTKRDIESCLSRELEPYLELAKDATIAQRWKFVLRETEPQHFNIDGGLYFSHLKHNPSFFECSQFQGSADNFRNQALMELLENHNLSSTIPVIPLFSALEPLTQLHFEGEDCTHYCYDPMRFWVTWEGLYNVLATSHDY